MADATRTLPESIATLEVDEIRIKVRNRCVVIELTETVGGRSNTLRPIVIGDDRFGRCLDSFCDSVPKRRLLQWLVAEGDLPIDYVTD